MPTQTVHVYMQAVQVVKVHTCTVIPCRQVHEHSCPSSFEEYKNLFHKVSYYDVVTNINIITHKVGKSSDSLTCYKLHVFVHQE